MIVLPAIDIKNGNCVRLVQGKIEDETIYYNNPVDIAKYFEKIGADYIHIVDLDGAFNGEPKNKELIRMIASSVNIPIEIGGGIRELKTAEDYINAGASRVIIGTKAIEDINFVKELIDKYGDKIAVSLDALDDKLTSHGWTETCNVSVLEKAKELQEIGLNTLIYTDISRDGMLTEPNFEILEDLNNKLDMNIVASGGIASTKHLDRCKELGLYGAITGKAIYEKKIDLEDYLSKRD